MTNSDIADLFKFYADLSELHGANPFKTKQFSNAYFRVDKLQIDLENKTLDEIEKIEGIGKNIASKIIEINTTGSFKELDEVISITPKGVIEMMKIKGIGPKKIAVIWKELEIEEIGELLYACKENRLAQAKGFGLKTQQNVISQIEFMYASANKFHYAKVEQIAFELENTLKTQDFIQQVSLCGQIRRQMEVLDFIEMLASTSNATALTNFLSQSELFSNVVVQNDNCIDIKFMDVPGKIYVCENQIFAWKLLEHTSSAEHVQLLNLNDANKNLTTEKEIYESIKLPFVEPELREGTFEIKLAKENNLPNLITLNDLKGALHNHSTWSDGLNSIAEMANACKKMGLSYFGIADHSKAAFYANGLSEERIIQQHAEIDKINEKNTDFKIFKGIECDILYNGQLDYENEVLKTFDYVVASVHSILKMNEEKAMSRLITAIENPYTTILGHPTGRLLLMREGYPINHHKIIDACAANKVAIEINAHPYRLDLDWRYINYALEKGVMLSVNPDAHNMEGLKDMYFGIQVARKGGLSKNNCLNALKTDDLSAYFVQKKSM
jgi:DNA polymerase (family 10)